jgi:diguanylate cyclase (GGDEF)-like protein
MSSAGFVLAMNLCVAGLLAGAFAAIAAYDARVVAARWFAGAYAIGMSYYVMLALMPLIGGTRPAVVVEFAIFLAALAAFNVGIARKYEVASPWRLMAVIAVFSAAAVWISQDLPRQSFTRLMAYQAPYFVMQAIGFGLVLSGRGRRRSDRALAALLAASALYFLSKPFMAQALGGWGSSPRTYLDSTYAIVSQTTGTVIALSVALMALVVLVRDLLSDMSEKSETDTLSQLLNRRGFERRATLAIERSVEQGVPLSLVLVDLDHFKSINDRFGHAAGDRVIAALSGFLKAAASDHYVVGRVGGEEFAIVLPGAHLAAARLFAEGARSAFSAVALEGFPKEHSFTASFGVAERLVAERIPELMQRADGALYLAKNEGRDCVRVADAQGAARPAQSA